MDTRAENGFTALHMAALSGTLVCVQLLLEAGASMMVRTVNQGRNNPADVVVGSTPLHCAAFRGDLGIVQALLQVGPAVDISLPHPLSPAVARSLCAHVHPPSGTNWVQSHEAAMN